MAGLLSECQRGHTLMQMVMEITDFVSAYLSHVYSFCVDLKTSVRAFGPRLHPLTCSQRPWAAAFALLRVMRVAPRERAWGHILQILL